MEPLTNYKEDVLADVLGSIHLQGSLYCRAHMGAPWGFHVSSRDFASFHLVTGGQCWLVVEGLDEPALIEEGDLVILPHGHAHTMRDHPETPVTKLEDLVAGNPPNEDGAFLYGGMGALTSLVCGGLQFEDHTTNPLMSALPTIIHIRRKDGESTPWLRLTVNLVKAEASVNQPGAETVITRLSEILFIQAVRAFISEANDREIGWLGALKDPQIGQAIALIHQHPEEAWTVESLAFHVGMSRSAFSAKFRLLVGESPMRYTTRWRLNKAAGYLRNGTRKLAEIARLVGYDSEVSFSKAFKRYMGIAPGTYRRRGRSTFDIK